MVSITVLYKDLSKKTCHMHDIGDLPKDNVLFIKLSTDTREGKLANISQINGFDNYAVLHKKDGTSDWYMLCGWDEDDFIWRRECNDCNNRVPVDLPIGRMHVKFEGVAVSQEEWKKALIEINKL